MKKGKLLEVLRIVVMCIVLDKKGSLELLSFSETICDIPSDQILTKKFLEWF